MAVRYQQGHIKSSDFTYGVVSEFGYLSLMITSLNDFETFATLIRSGSLDGLWNSQIDNGVNVGTAEGSISKLAAFLQEQKSGLSLLFRPIQADSQGSSTSNWTPKGLDSSNKLVNIDCDK